MRRGGREGGGGGVGEEGLKRKNFAPGATRRLSEQERAAAALPPEFLLARGALTGTRGFRGEVWTCQRVVALM